MTPYEDTANKYLPFDVLTNIPAQVLQARDPGQTHREMDARLVHDAFLLMFLFTMPCLLPKQVRDAQIYGTANVFKGQISPFAGMTVPEWVADELRCNPAAEFWQVRFRRRETNGQALCAVLPQNLIPILEEYLVQHRPLLVGNHDPGTLFLNKRGGPLSARQLTALVGKITVRFANCRMMPAMIRRLFAYCWLAENPDDYYTLSCVFGHADVRSTIRRFGARLSVSGAMRKVEEWARRRKTEDPCGERKD